MSLGLLSLILHALAALAYGTARSRAVASAQGDTRLLHSLPAFHGRIAALAVILPAALVLILWLVVEGLPCAARPWRI